MSSTIPYRQIDDALRGQLWRQRAKWTFLVSVKQGPLRGQEFQTMMRIYGSDWFREHWLSFSIYLAAMAGCVRLMLLDDVTSLISMVAILVGTVGYLTWVNKTMDVIRPGDIEQLLPYLSVSDVERSYLEGVAALANCTVISESQRGDVLTYLAELLQNERRLIALTSSRGELPSREQLADQQEAIERARDRASDPHARELLEQAIDVVRKRSEHAARSTDARDQVTAARMLIAQQIAAVRDQICHLNQQTGMKTADLPMLLARDADARHVLRAVEEVRELAD